MKTLFKILLIVFITFGLFSCKDKIEDTYLVNEPVYMSYDNLRESFNVKSGELIIQPGKIYFKDNYIFVNEYLKGIHIVDNTDPENPDVVKFLEVPGNVDMSIKGNILYADSYVDLLSIDISDLDNIKEVDRDTNVFPYVIPEVEEGVIELIDENKGVIVSYNVTEKTEKIENNSDYLVYRGWQEDMIAIDFSGVASNGKGGGSDIGTGGSMARFTMYDNYLYAINNSSLKLFNVTVGDNPSYEKEVYIGWDIETIFPYEEKLFIGSRSGMYVYSIQDPANPDYITEFRHASACDPVVVEDNYAYVTLRGGNLCGAIASQLDVIDISTIEDPKLLNSYPMEDPYGLGIDDDVLFICDGDAGLKIYDATDKMKIDSNMVAHYSEMDAFDVIPLGDVLIMISIDGLFQYDYSSLDNIKQLSRIPIYSK